MLTKVEAHTPQGSVLELPLDATAGSTAHPVQIRDLQGLGPVKATVNTATNAAYDGEIPTGSAVGKRNIVLTVGLNPNWEDNSYASLRTLLYGYFIPKRSVTLHFFSSHMENVKIEGTVESFEPTIFSKDPEIVISILCLDPDFVAITPVVVTGTVGNGSADTVIDNPGNQPGGFELKVESSVATPTYTGLISARVKNPSTHTHATTVTINAGQYFKLITTYGKRRAHKVNTSTQVATSVLGSMANGSEWTQIEPGINQFAVIGTTPGQTWTLTYSPRYVGL